MKSIACPHCMNHDIVTSRIPKDVVAVVPCSSCHELVVVFRDKAIALNRDILENGLIEDRKAHIAGVITEFLEPEMMSFGINKILRNNMADLFNKKPAEKDTQITEKEIEEFRANELDLLDNSTYFKKHFC